MSNELNVSLGQAGQTVTASLYAGGLLVSSGVPCAEVTGQGGYYTGSMPAVPAGYYDVQFFANGVLRGSGNIGWSGTAEIRVDTAMQASSYSAPPTIAAIQLGLATAAQVTSSQSAIIAAMPVLSGIATSANVASAQSAILAAVGNPVQVGGAVGSISGVTFPTNFGGLAIDSSGRTLLQPGAINFAQFASAYLAYTQRCRLVTTGLTTPPSADPTWNVAGSYNNEPFYQSSGGTWVAWNNSSGWTISTAVGVNGANYWTTTGFVNGTYVAGGSASGAPTVVSHGNSVLSSFEPDVAFPTAAQVSTMPTSGTISTVANLTTAQAAIQAQVGTPLQASSYIPPTTPPTVIQIRQEMDSNSSKLAGAATSAGIVSATNSVLTAVGSPLQSSLYSVPPSAAVIAATTASVLFVDGATNPLKVNSDHSVALTSSSGTIANYITVPPAVAEASNEPAVITCIRGDTLRIALPPMGNVTTRTKLVMTAKACVTDSDAQAVFQVIEGIGLTRLNGTGSVTSATANLTVSDAMTGAATLEIDAIVTATMAIRDLVWDVQAFLATGITTPIGGVVSIIADVTQSVT